jgi:hypothetical protein
MEPVLAHNPLIVKIAGKELPIGQLLPSSGNKKRLAGDLKIGSGLSPRDRANHKDRFDGSLMGVETRGDDGNVSQWDLSKRYRGKNL